MDTEGNILAAKSKQSFKETFGVNIDGEKYGGILSNATLSLVNEVKNTVGEAQAIIKIHNNWQINVTVYSIISDISWTCTSSFIQY
jgi:predicted component of type VI protein secretion system